MKLSGDVPRFQSYGIYISQLVRFARCCTSVWMSILKISKLLLNCWYRVIDIISFEKHLESSLDHTLNFCRNSVIFRSNNMCLKELSSGLLRWSSLQTKEGQRHTEFHQFKRFRRRQYDPLIIERTIGLVLGPFTTLYRPSLKQCTLTNKEFGTIWRALSKPPQRRQGLIFVPSDC